VRDLRAFKYVDPEHADAVARGSLRLGTLSGYADLESARADPWDGAILGLTTPGEVLDSDNPRDRASLAKFGCTSADGVRVRFQGINFFQGYAPTFCFCMSDSSDNAHLLAGQSQAIFEISDYGVLAQAILNQHAYLMSEFQAGPVAYGCRSKPIREAADLYPDPMAKDERFGAEREIRAIFRPRIDGITAFNTRPNGAIAALLRRIA